MKKFITCLLHQILLGCEVKEDEMGRICSMHVRDEKCIEIFDGKSEGKKQLGRHRHGWKDNNRMNLR
jgi:hypothetical protein